MHVHDLVFVCVRSNIRERPLFLFRTDAEQITILPDMAIIVHHEAPEISTKYRRDASRPCLQELTTLEISWLQDCRLSSLKFLGSWLY